MEDNNNIYIDNDSDRSNVEMKVVKIEIEGIVEDENELERFMEFIRKEEWVNEVRTKVRRLIPKNRIKVEEYEEI